MSKIRKTHPAVLVSVLALCAGLLPACGGGVSGRKVIVPEGCVLEAVDLQGTWIISHVSQNLSCAGGTTFQTTAATNRFSPVNVARDESLPGFSITATGLTVEVADVTCHITWTYLDADTNALYSCFTTFEPDTRTAGGSVEAGHCSQITPVNEDGTHGASCLPPPPYLDSFIVVEGS